MVLLALQIHTQTQSHIYIHTYNLNKICLFKTAFTITFKSFLNLLYQLLLTRKRGQARNIDHTCVLISTLDFLFKDILFPFFFREHPYTNLQKFKYARPYSLNFCAIFCTSQTLIQNCKKPLFVSVHKFNIKSTSPLF